MSLLKGLGSLLGGDTLKDVGNIIDDLHTSEDEKLEKTKIRTDINNRNKKHKFLKGGKRYETW